MRFIKKLKYSIFAFTIILLNIKNVFAANIFDCNSISAFGKDMQNLFDFLKVGIVLLVIGLSTYDFLKAILQKDEKDIKSKNLRSLVRKIRNYHTFLAENKDFNTKIYDVGDGISVSVKKNEKK